MVWTGTYPELLQFMEELGNNRRNIQLTFTADRCEISFLDLRIKIIGDQLATSTFRKDTAANTLLRDDSHHPRSLIRGIPVGQFL